MDRTPAERTVSFRPSVLSPPQHSIDGTLGRSGMHMSMNNGGGNGSVSHLTINSAANNNNNTSASRLTSAVAPGYAQLSPTTGGLRVRRVASHRRLQVSPGPGTSNRHAESVFEMTVGSSPQLASLLHRRAEDPLVSLVHHQHSNDSMMDATSNASPTLQSPVGAYPTGALPSTLSRDSVTMHELLALQHQQQQQSMLRGVTVMYPQGASPLDPHMRMPDYASMQEDAHSNGGDSANEDRVQVRVEGYYEGGNVNVLIPNDLPPSTLLYVLTASDGRDLMFKLTQYTLQLTICFLKMPSLFSPEVQVFTGPWAERLYRNYNTIRHGRSLFKMGRGLLNLFTVQTVCERMWMKYEGDVSRHTCAVLLPIVTRVETALLMLGASPVWGRALSRQLLHRSQAAELTPGQRRLDESQDSMANDWCIQERMRSGKHAAHPGALLADDTFTHVAEVERSSAHHHVNTRGDGGGGGGTGILRSMLNSSGFTHYALHKVMHAMGLAAEPGAASGTAGSGSGARLNAAHMPSQPVLPHSPADEERSSADPSAHVSPHTPKTSFPANEEGGTLSVEEVVAAALVAAGEEERGENTAKSNAKGSGSISPKEMAAEAATTADAADTDAAPTTDSSAHTSAGKEADRSASSTSTATTATTTDDDDGASFPRTYNHHKTPPFVHGTMPLVLEHDPLHSLSLAKRHSTAATAAATAGTTADNAQPTPDSYDAESGGEGGRMTLLRPLPRPAQNSSTTDPECSGMGEDGFTMRLDSTLHDDTSSLHAAVAPASSREPMSMPDNWRPAMAPTVPPSQADDFGYGPSLGFPQQPSTLPPHTVTAQQQRKQGKQGQAALVSSSDNDSSAAAGGVRGSHTREASPSAAKTADGESKKDKKTRKKKECPPFDVLPVLPALTTPPPPPPPVSLPQSPSSSLSALARHRSANEVANESEMSMLSSEANSSFHIRPSGASGAMTTWLNELQPASAALPARVRKSIMQFNPLLMSLLGIRSLAAAFRRFLRDATLISSEKFINFSYVEAHRKTIMRFINRCWLIISVIDLLLNTVRLLQPGWVKYATARQNVRCRCGCQGDEDPADTVWRTHGFIARRKTDLFFPPLNLDYGAPFVSYVSYMEAADPARLIPACSRCGCLYKEIPAEVGEFEGMASSTSALAPPLGTVSMMVAGTASVSRSSPGAHTSLQNDAAFGVSMSRPSQAVSEEVERSLSLGATTAAEWEKPRWVQMYEAEVHEADEARRRASVAAASGGSGNAASGGLGARLETQKPSSATLHTASGEETSRSVAPGLADLAHVQPVQPPSATRNAVVTRGDNDAHDSADRETSTTGILFVPWMMRKFFDYVWLLRVHPNLTATLLLEVRYLAEFYLSYKYCFGGYESYTGDAPLSNILHPYGAIAGFVSAAVGLLRVVESAPTSLGQ